MVAEIATSVRSRIQNRFAPRNEEYQCILSLSTHRKAWGTLTRHPIEKQAQSPAHIPCPGQKKSYIRPQIDFYTKGEKYAGKSDIKNMG
jgi:hypothetical protein